METPDCFASSAPLPTEVPTQEKLVFFPESCGLPGQHLSSPLLLLLLLLLSFSSFPSFGLSVCTFPCVSWQAATECALS